MSCATRARRCEVDSQSKNERARTDERLWKYVCRLYDSSMNWWVPPRGIITGAWYIQSTYIIIRWFCFDVRRKKVGALVIIYVGFQPGTECELWFSSCSSNLRPISLTQSTLRIPSSYGPGFSRTEMPTVLMDSRGISNWLLRIWPLFVKAKSASGILWETRVTDHVAISHGWYNLPESVDDTH
jgi:hypothetical protein